MIAPDLPGCYAQNFSMFSKCGPCPYREACGPAWGSRLNRGAIRNARRTVPRLAPPEVREPGNSWDNVVRIVEGGQP